MKHLILTMGLGFLWACSGDPQLKGSRDLNQANGQGTNETADATSSGISTGTTTEASPVGHNEGGDGAIGVGSTSPVPPTSTADEGDGVVTPPHKVTGAFLVGTLLPREEGEPLKVGLVAKQDDARLSDQPEEFATTWNLSLSEDGIPASLAKSSDVAYDRILIFDGTDQEFLALQESISVQVSVVEGGEETNQLHSVIKNTLSELLGL